jgi:ribosome-associated protein
MLDLREICSFADYFVICSGDSQRQIQAICDEITAALSNEDIAHCRYEGNTDSGWVVLDLGEVIVHIFASQERDYYKLERLWGKATPVVRIL